MPHEIVVPELGESILEATVARWLKSEGDELEAAEAVVELETDKVNLEVGSEQPGVLAEIRVEEGQDVEVGQVLGVVEAAGGAGQPDGEGGPEATPVAQKLAEEWQIDLAQVSGTGSGGRVTKSDVEAFKSEAADEERADTAGRAAERATAAEQAERTAERATAAEQAERTVERAPAEERAERAAEPAPTDGEERVRMSRRRRTIARVLVEAQREAAILTTFNEVDMSQIMRLRRAHNPDFEQRHGVKLGITSFFVKACIAALKRFPRLNAELQGDEIVLKKHYDIGIAIGDERGLVVPVLRAADSMNFAEIEARIEQLVQRARQSELTLEELQGGTFSITNGGVYGSLLSTPILNPPQSGILGLHKIEQRPVAVEEEIVIRPMMYVALSYDHRIVDGREAVQFLVAIKEYVEQPAAMLLED